MEEIIEDISQLEKDANNINCNPIIVFIKDLVKCVQDSLSYFFSLKSK